MFWVTIPFSFFCQTASSCQIARAVFGGNANFGNVISLLIPNVIILAGIIFFIWIIIAGWGVITSAGEESSAQDKAKAKAAITYAVIGFLLVVSAYFILQIVGVITGINFINPAI